MKSVNLYDYLVIAGYFVFMLGIGIYFTRINKSGKEYFAGGNMIPWWVSGMTLYMANFSAWSFTAAAGTTYTEGSFMLINFSLGILSYSLGALLTGARWRRTRSISPVEYTYTRYNVTTQQFLSWVIGINFTLSAGVQLASTSKLLAPVLGVDILMITLVTGVVILSYTFLGGIWAVSITDVVQGVILICTAAIIVPLSMDLVGGPAKMLEALPPLSWDHVVNGVKYDEWWLLSMLLITTLGFAGGSGQRFYSVKDEASARKVGFAAAGLCVLGPAMFGIPPLVARMIWPDLSQVEFFKPYIGNNPQDLVYIGLAMHLLPNGLIGVFVAAMLAATMSTLSSVYNMVSSIFARDMYQGLFRRSTKDEELLKIGRIASVCIGILVTLLALIFLNSKLGIFNIMMAFFTLFNIPVSVPLAFGLIFRRIPPWSAAAGITWGLLAGVAVRFLFGWAIGPQVFFSFFMTFVIFATSRWIGDLHSKNRAATAGIGTGVAVLTAVLFVLTAPAITPAWAVTVGWVVAAAFGVTFYLFAGLFTRENADERGRIDTFFKKLDTPVDVQKEVYGAGVKQVSVFPLVGATMIVMASLLSLVFFTDMHGGESVLGVLIAMMLVFGVLMWYFGKKSEVRAARANEAA